MRHVLEGLREQLAARTGVLQRLTDAVALLDVLCALASAATAAADDAPYVRPQFSSSGDAPIARANASKL